MINQLKTSQHKTSSRLLIAAAITAAIGATSLASAESLSADISEGRKEGQIIGAYTLNRHLNPFKIDVDVEGTTALLSGEVEEAVDKDLAEQIALGVDGVDKVDNQIKVNPDYKPVAKAKGEQDFGEVVSDATITASVKSKLLWNEHTDGLDINVDTRAGNVTLTGVADSTASKELAERLAVNTEGVRDVTNDLRVETKSSQNGAGTTGTGTAGAADAGDAISDSWITSKVKTTFLLSRNISGSDIGITTHDGVVTLTGAVDSGAERDLAVEVAKDIRGVKAVKAGNLEVKS